MAKLPAADATRVSALCLRDAIGALSRLSNTATKIGEPALNEALVAARTQPIKAAITYQNNQRNRPVPRGGPAEWTTVALAPPGPAVRPIAVACRHRVLKYALADVLQHYARNEPEFDTNDALGALNEVYCWLQQVGDGLLRPPDLENEAPVKAVAAAIDAVLARRVSEAGPLP
jgi:hypothetical protein